MSRIGSSGVVVLLAWLAGCGGGGGGAGGGCPPGSVLTVFPTSFRLTAGSPAVEFGAGVTDCIEDIHWHLAGPGSIDRSAGVPVRYTPPASVAALTTATLTASVGTLAESATITVDPAVLLLAGRVITTGGAPIEGATVRVGSTSATTDAGGAFTLAGASPPYDVSATSPSGLLTSVYPGLRRADPTLVIFDLDPILPRSANVTGALSGGAGFPQPDGRETGVAFRSPEAADSCAVQAGASTYFMGFWWPGPASVTGAVHALQWQVDAGGKPVSYDGYGSRTGVALTSGSTAAGQDVAISPIAASASVAGSLVNPPGNALAISLTAVLGDGARIRVFPPPGDPSPFASGYAGAFSIPVPPIPGATFDLVARQDYTGSIYQEAHHHGLAAGAADAELALGGLPIQDTPAPGATGLGPGTTFTWHTMPGDPVYVISFRGQGTNPGYDIFVPTNHFTVPAGIPLPSAAPYTWRIRGTSAFSTVEEAAGPGGFMAGGQLPYLVAQSDPWPFTTAP